MTKEKTMPICPECENGKHLICAGFAFDEHDREVPCMCDCRTPEGYVGRSPEDRMQAFADHTKESTTDE